MRLVSARPSGDILSQVKARFAEFNQTSSPSKGRKYPSELQALAVQALAEGAAFSTIRQLTGASSTALTRWSKGCKRRSQRQQKAHAPRRLEVVGGAMVQGPIVVRLPSGVSLELPGGEALSGDLLARLSTLGGDHAASR